MRIAQITPGVIPIPPNGWGAVEKIIWEYTKILRSLGHHVEILYANDVNPGEWDIVHVHMANLALFLKSRGIPYVFSHHDHHAYHFGKDSSVYKQNLEAIEGSILSFVHAKYLIDFFGSAPQLRYLGHGANIQDYIFKDRSQQILSGETRLLMMAHNGIIGDPFFDRKGFIPGVLAAKQLNLPITIICPSKINKDFFEAHPEIYTYEKLQVLYDLDYKTSLRIADEHHIFLNPGVLEAGHPNLTVTEHICMGIPVVGTMELDLPGQKRINFTSSGVDYQELSEAIKEVIDSYSCYVLNCKEQREILSWEVVVSRMLMEYTNFSGIPQKRLLLEDYANSKINHKSISKETGFYYWFKRDPYFYKSSEPASNSAGIIFRDSKTGSIKNYLCPGDNKRNWVRTTDDPDQYIDWEIVLVDGADILEVFKMDLRGQHVLIEVGKSVCPREIIDSFIEKTGCIATLHSGLNSSKPHFKFSNSDENNFYRILNSNQIQDYFVEKKRLSRNTLILPLTTALGDSIALSPYAQAYAEKNNIKCDIISGFGFLFEGIYQNLNFIPEVLDLSSYTELIPCNYKFDLPLQEGFAKHLKIDQKAPIRPKIIKSKKERPLNKKYVCFSIHSTAQAKFWNNNEGWIKLCEILKQNGYIPVCIDRYKTFGIEGRWNPIPWNCMDKTEMDLTEMINWIEHCDFFIGLSSGLSWVAHSLGKKVVMISGVTSVDNEFKEDCLRIHRDDVCNSCFNQPERFPFDRGDWMWCPLHKETSRHFECTKKISAKQIMNKILDAGWINRDKKSLK
jgi:autotransporter strand-loop-strand O-heptosyltransferase